MNPSDVFSTSNMLAMIMWVLMIFLPKWKVTQILTRSKLVPIILSVLYTIYIGLAINIGGAMDFGSLKSVMALFTEEHAVLAGWVHYLAFDLLIGMSLLKQNEKVNLHQIIMAPCLFATFMFGPVGFLLFSILKSLKKK